MKKSFWFIGIIVIIALAGGFVIFGGADKTKVPSTTDELTEQQSNSVSPTTSQYVEYSPEIIAKTTGTKILFFYAPWCPQCRALEKSIKAGSIPQGTTIIKIDYDSNQALRQKYEVTIQTTLVRVDDAGNLVEKYVAYDEPTLQSLVDNLL